MSYQANDYPVPEGLPTEGQMNANASVRSDASAAYAAQNTSGRAAVGVGGDAPGVRSTLYVKLFPP
jgi:hypothetical protein